MTIFLEGSMSIAYPLAILAGTVTLGSAYIGGKLLDGAAHLGSSFLANQKETAIAGINANALILKHKGYSDNGLVAAQECPTTLVHVVHGNNGEVNFG